MKGQFVFPVYSNSEKEITLKFDPEQMTLVEMGQNQISDRELKMYPKEGKPDVGTVMRTNPAKGGTFGQFYVLGS